MNDCYKDEENEVCIRIYQQSDDANVSTPDISSLTDKCNNFTQAPNILTFEEYFNELCNSSILQRDIHVQSGDIRKAFDQLTAYYGEPESFYKIRNFIEILLGCSSFKSFFVAIAGELEQFANENKCKPACDLHIDLLMKFNLLPDNTDFFDIFIANNALIEYKYAKFVLYLYNHGIPIKKRILLKTIYNAQYCGLIIDSLIKETYLRKDIQFSDLQPIVFIKNYLQCWEKNSALLWIDGWIEYCKAIDKKNISTLDIQRFIKSEIILKPVPTKGYQKIFINKFMCGVSKINITLFIDIGTLVKLIRLSINVPSRRLHYLAQSFKARVGCQLYDEYAQKEDIKNFIEKFTDFDYGEYDSDDIIESDSEPD